jgi:acyl-CoA thioesterase II
VSAGRAESLERLLAIFDVAPADAGLTRFIGTSESRGRNVVEGSQLLGQAMVAAAKALPGRTVRSAHGLFAAAANPAQQIKFTVSPVRAGRSFASAGMAYARGQVLTADGRTIASFTQDAMIRAFAPGLGL